jgi:hypothetical protein
MSFVMVYVFVLLEDYNMVHVLILEYFYDFKIGVAIFFSMAATQSPSS